LVVERTAKRLLEHEKNAVAGYYGNDTGDYPKGASNPDDMVYEYNNENSDGDEKKGTTKMNIDSATPKKVKGKAAPKASAKASSSKNTSILDFVSNSATTTTTTTATTTNPPKRGRATKATTQKKKTTLQTNDDDDLATADHISDDEEYDISQSSATKKRKAPVSSNSQSNGVTLEK